MKLKVIISVVVAALSANIVLADKISNKYAGVQYATVEVSDEFEPKALIAHFGKYFHKNVSIEGRLGIGLDSDTKVDNSGITTKTEIDNIFGFYGVGHANLSDCVSVYAIAGLTMVGVTASVTNLGSESNNETGLSYGVGTDVVVGGGVAINIEYIQYINRSDVDISALSLGLRFPF